jgi:PAS domain S-box-containing protein
MGQPPLRIILIEDDETDYWTMRRLLGSSGKRPFLLDWVPSVRSGLDALAGSPYDVCLLDFDLPDGNGSQFLSEANRRGTKCPIILLTLQIEQAEAAHALPGVSDTLIRTELTPALLARSIRYAVERFSAIEDVRKAQEALQLAELRFRSVAQSASEAIVLSDGNGRIVSWNKAAERMFGYSDSEVTGFPVELLFTEHYRERFKVKGRYSLIGKTVEMEGLRKDGSGFAIELSLASWSTNEGTFLTVILRDVSERRRVEELRLAKEGAEEASRAKSTFIARMSHELRTPLSSIMGFAQILLKNKKRNLEADDIDFLQRILLNAKDQLNLINTLLDLSRIEAGRMEAKTEPVAVETLVHDTIRQIENRARGKPVTLAAEIPEKLFPISSDSAKLKQVLLNLIDNALKFTDKGTVTVRVHAASDGRPVRIDVIDTGRGIAPQHLRRIFEPFERVVSRDAPSPPGTGLGLAISRSLCELLGGRLEVRSQLGSGSTFSIVLGSEAYRLPLTA